MHNVLGVNLYASCIVRIRVLDSQDIMRCVRGFYAPAVLKIKLKILSGQRRYNRGNDD